MRLCAGSAILLLTFFTASTTQASLMFFANFQKGSQALDTNILVEQSGNDLRFTLTVDDSTTGNIGDLRGFFFDVSDESLLAGLTASGIDVTDQAYLANSVNNLGQGAVIKPMGPFDAGVEFGTPGMGKDDIQSTSFLLTHSSQSLALNSFFRKPVGINYITMAVRGTSVGPQGGLREGSSKTAVIPEPASVLIWLSIGLSAMFLAQSSRRFRQS